MDALIPAMAKREGVTEILKATDQMVWVGHMNNIRNRAEEILLHELVYAQRDEGECGDATLPFASFALFHPSAFIDIITVFALETAKLGVGMASGQKLEFSNQRKITSHGQI